MKVLFFAGSREIAGTFEIELALSEKQSTAQVWNQLIDRYPQLEKIRSSSRLARNGTYADADSEFENGDEVAVIPPVSGG